MKQGQVRNAFHYKGYTGSASISLEDRRLYGCIENIYGLVLYEAKTLDELESEFKAAVDDYLQFCSDMNLKPEKPDCLESEF